MSIANFAGCAGYVKFAAGVPDVRLYSTLKPREDRAEMFMPKEPLICDGIEPSAQKCSRLEEARGSGRCGSPRHVGPR
jgi:hypothetical protein